eukprot:7382077-Prymnesium_polylepis.1
MPPPGALVCVGVDDIESLRVTQRLVFQYGFRADMARSASVGASRAEQERFVDLALGRVDADGRPVPPGARRHADVALIDQNVACEGHPTLLGSDLAAALAREGFSGLACIFTGSSAEAIGRLNALPGVDLAEPKLTDMQQLAERCCRALAAKRRSTGLDVGWDDRGDGAGGSGDSGDGGSDGGGSGSDTSGPDASLVDLSQFARLPRAALRALFAPLFDASHRDGLGVQLRAVEEAVRSGGGRVNVHALEGTVAACGLVGLAAPLQRLRAAPSEARLAALREAVKAVHRALQAAGVVEGGGG